MSLINLLSAKNLHVVKKYVTILTKPQCHQNMHMFSSAEYTLSSRVLVFSTDD